MYNVNNHQYDFINFSELGDDEINLVFEWRNHPSVRKWMYSSEAIVYENHLNFFKNIKDKKNCLYFLVKRDGMNIGVFTLTDIIDKHAEYGYYLGPEFHHGNLGVEFYYATLNYTFDVLDFDILKGYALQENKSAKSLNFLFGFEGGLIDKLNKKYYDLTLTSEKWNSVIKSDEKIRKLLNLTNK